MAVPIDKRSARSPLRKITDKHVRHIHTPDSTLLPENINDPGKILYIHGRGKFSWIDGSEYDGEWRAVQKEKLPEMIVATPTQPTTNTTTSTKEHGKANKKAATNGTTQQQGQTVASEHANETKENEKEGQTAQTPDIDPKSRVRHGFGTYRLTNGETYSGQWVEDMPHGYGTMKFVSGASYEGLFDHGKFQGSGEYQFSNGAKYIGQFECNMMHGIGSFIPATNNKHISKMTQHTPPPDVGRYEGRFYRDGFVNAEGYFVSLRPTLLIDGHESTGV